MKPEDQNEQMREAWENSALPNTAMVKLAFEDGFWEGAKTGRFLAHRDAQPAVACSFPERDVTKPAEEQGLFRKFDVRRVDGSDAPGGKHHGCEYFVLDLNHDTHAPAALRAYAQACNKTHPQLSAELLGRFGPQPAGAVDQRMRTALQEIANTVNYAQWYQETADKALEDANHSDGTLDKVPAAVAVNEQLYSALEGLLAITRDSQGVAGYHLNGVVAKWDEFEEVSAAEVAIAAAEAAKGGV
ncbi:hypothetical protein [Limnobacter sp.]|uniref:hypothetical protein n=1 Tax=Limnobacter sp. TaxID=2003368 RepID=UPI00311DC78E